MKNNTQKTVMLNSFQHPHLNLPLPKEEEILNQVQDDNRMGFTLIELLVVVLIIGILAAVAVPQYQKTVGKARVMQAVTSLKALADAQEIYLLSNAEMASDLSELDVEVTNTKEYTFICNQEHFIGSCAAIPQIPGLPLLEFVPSSVDRYKSKHWCQVFDITTMTTEEKTKALEICKTLGPQDESITHDSYYLIQ